MKISKCSKMQFVPASHEDPKNPGSLKKVLFTKNDLAYGQMQMLNWSLLPVGRAFRRHFHQDMQEVFVMIKGTVEIKLDQESTLLSAGDAILIPIGAEHEMRNIGDIDAEYIALGIATGTQGKTIVTQN